MRPKQPEAEPQEELFRARLEDLVDPRHPLIRLAGLSDWGRFKMTFGPLYTDGIGRPGPPMRLMVGLHLLKHMDGLSGEAVCARYLDSPYVRHERRRRNAIEPLICHIMSDGYLGRIFLLGTEGDATNVILAAAGQNPRLLRAWLVALRLNLPVTPHQTSAALQPGTAAA